jgi:ABC-2 type transport system ATP-binding protein
LLASLARQGRAVLVSSHLMSELQDTASQLVVVGRGKVIADGSVRDLLASVARDQLTLRTSAPALALDVLTRAGASVAATAPGTLVISGLPAEQAVALLGERGVPVAEISAHRASLEEAYLELTRDAVEYRAAAEAQR